MSKSKKIIIPNQDSEADTCRKEILPKLYESKWDDDKILEQRYFTDGKIIVLGRKAKRKEGKKADYILRYSRDYPIAVVEAKKRYKKAADGLQQAKEYAEILQLNFAYATNGTEIIEFDFKTGIEKTISSFPTPAELWQRENQENVLSEFSEEILLKPFFNSDKKPRYYQTIAINRAVKSISEGKKRILLTLATGTGKTSVAFQIIYKLWFNRWNNSKEHRRPKILFLADRSVLVQDPHSKDFSVFGDARCLLPDDRFTLSREVYFSTYQAIAEDTNRVGLFRKFPKNFFDLIVIDECHRGSASDDSSWRVILEYFLNAVQVGMTATPLREDNKDTYMYFGNPLYTYSLKQGIEDGFLAPYIVHRIVPDVDATGYRPHAGQKDKFGNEIPDGIYSTPDFETRLSYLPRTKAIARHLYTYMCKNGRFDKTIIFCVDQEHADHMRREMSNLNSNLVQQYPNYIVRIVAEEGEIGKGFLSKFMDIDEEIPVIVTTSKLLSTGVDVQTCKNIVIFRQVNSMTEFKQIVGRGTRVREDKDKLFFTILDYTGSATRNFADPDFDGEPPLISTENIDEEGQTIEGTYEEEVPEQLEETENEFDDFDESETEIIEGTGERIRKYYVEEGEVTIAAESVQILDSYGKLRTVQFTQYAKEKINIMFPSYNIFLSNWSNLDQRKTIVEELESQGISIEQLEENTKTKDLDPFDLICYVAYDLKPKTRKERAELLKKNKTDFFMQYSDKAKEILNMVLDKYTDYGLRKEDDINNLLKLPPISEQGNIIEIAKEFGGIENLRKALDELQILLFAA
ncbi:MAG: EcoAI/FtnUII family type I restriction enzme subunit R [Candidatus Odinarchaeota archaeon]